MTCAGLLWIVMRLAAVGDGCELSPPSWALGEAHVRTRGAHEHEWIEGPRGGVYYLTPRGNKVYLRRSNPLWAEYHR